MPDYDVVGPRCFYEPAWCGGGGVGGGTGASGVVSATGGREPFLWGKDRGCAFVTGRCDGPAWRGAPGYWCAADPSDDSLTAADVRASIDSEGCSVGRLAVAHCNLREHAEEVPAAYRHFGDGLANLGGAAMEDYCP